MDLNSRLTLVNNTWLLVKIKKKNIEHAKKLLNFIRAFKCYYLTKNSYKFFYLLCSHFILFPITSLKKKLKYTLFDAFLQWFLKFNSIFALVS